jgi:hypothetical protein
MPSITAIEQPRFELTTVGFGYDVGLRWPYSQESVRPYGDAGLA